MAEPVTIGYGANKWIKESNTQMITLYTPAPQGTYSMHKSGTTTDYQVPAGKKFILLNISAGVGRNGSNTNIYMEFYQNTVTDSTVGAFMVAHARAGVNSGGSAGIQNQNMPTYVEIPAGNYVVSRMEHHAVATCIGIETDV